MNPLTERLARRIAETGAMTVAEYINQALTDPAHGYYTSREPFGAAGDFITAPEISQLFGELIGLWCAEMWRAIGRPTPCLLVELGPGRGTLLADGLRTMAQAAPDALAAMRLHLMEASRPLRRTQAKQLATASIPPAWHDDLASVPAAPMLLIANEFFDALPIHQYIHRADGWRERLIGVAGTGLAFIDGPRLPDPPNGLPEEPVAIDDIAELCPIGEALAVAIASRLAGDGGAALIIDYGPAKGALGNSLQAVRRHRFASILDRPGETDLSHHVDFAALAAAAKAAGAAVFGPVAQGLFLGRLGIDRRAAALIGATTKDAPTVAAAAGRAETLDQAIEGQVRRLVHPGRMGVLFKALALTQPGLAAPPGFAAALRSRDRP